MSNSLIFLRQLLVEEFLQHFKIEDNLIKNKISVSLQQDSNLGDISTNAAMVLAGKLKQKPMDVAQEICTILTSPMLGEHSNKLEKHIKSATAVGPGFVNIKISDQTWHTIAHELLVHPEKCFKLSDQEQKKSYLIEFVSANPTGPLHLAHGRNAIIGDTLARVLSFLGHKVTREFYINDAGSQMEKFGNSLKTRVQELAGQKIVFPEDGYHGEYVIKIAEKLAEEHRLADQTIIDAAKELSAKPTEFFKNYAKTSILKKIKHDLQDYEVHFDNWFSEKTLHESGKVAEAVRLLEQNGFTNKTEDALWFLSTKFGDDKDRVLIKNNGEYTYIAADVAYHKNKFERGFDVILNVLGQDHHSYAKRINATMAALGFSIEKLKIVLYQLVRIKHGDVFIRMSKRKGNFESLQDVIEAIGVDAARYFYLARNPDSHLELDLDVALKKDTSNPLYYLQYAYVRTLSILKKACQSEPLAKTATALMSDNKDFFNQALESDIEHKLGQAEIDLIKKICQLGDVLDQLAQTHATNLIAGYATELAGVFHSYYNSNRILDNQDLELASSRLLVVKLANNALGLTLDLMGLSKPESM